MGKPVRKLLKDDAVSTIFDHNKDKRPLKRRTSLGREQSSTQIQLRENAFEHYGKCQKFEQELNTKSTQTTKEVGTISTQTIATTKRDVGTQTIETGFLANVDDVEESDESDDEPSKDLNRSFVLSDEDSDDQEEPNANKNIIKCSAFIVFWFSLVTLFARCFTCFATTKSLIRNTLGSLLTVKTVCINELKNIWKSQPSVKRQWLANIRMSAAVLFSANTFTRIAEYFRLADIQWIGKIQYYAFQKKYLSGVVNEAYSKDKDILMTQMKKKGHCRLGGDGRCDSSGHNVKYLTYSMFDQLKSKIISMAVTQVSEAGNSNRMEKMSFAKVLSELKEKVLNIEQITTDRHTGVRKHMREKEKSISQKFDAWHFRKSIRKNLIAVAKKKCNKEVNDWIRSIRLTNYSFSLFSAFYQFFAHFLFVVPSYVTKEFLFIKLFITLCLQLF